MISKKKDSGFSWIEFVIVLAILAIIAIMVLPGLLRASAERKAKEYFGISAVTNLSFEEKAMLAPMVGNRIAEIRGSWMR
ncbi:MAG: hypothetical protein A3J46_03155 [Candidatus Yanofskybacteria bacterium RIFCSPHIGHO2_02_FULL_41_11]|uniref:Type II secretion system protein GspG C-terminal domain-containing protein n=1 Tax=Candidatus Yanofskybacteria bacterium RIFCSPHIGHO2_02_FULL_41_11 TaxID=1802675 RepID=A0A1F8F6U2_9BACT|nr:MAG: hypothetical protein A3J46_03155 [Candidatus Yanofskybacteria bacterium RIFCSPHIGHO2_02_FULL_41_11]